jgi:tetratricopeptide (TPR) repeat protein
MRIPPRILVPVVAAVLTVGVVIVVLFWQLEGARALLSEQLNKTVGTGATIFNPITDSNAGTGDEALLHLRAGDVFALRGEWGEAEKEYSEAVKAKGGLTALRKLAQAQLQRRDIRAAQSTLDQLRREGARAEDVLLLESVILLRTGEIAKARALLDSAQESPHKHYGLALLSIIGGDNDNAKAELAAVSAGWEPVLRSYARILSGAYEEYTLFPESPAHHLQTLLSRALAQVQECELALPILSQVTAQQNDYRDAWIVQGFCELTSERYPEALASLEHAYQLDPEKAEIQYFLARTYIAQEDHANALTFLQYALRNGFNPEAEVRRLIASEALEIGNASLALEQYEALTKQEDATIDAYDAYVRAAIASNRAEEAYAKATEAIGKWPDDATAHELLGRSAAATNRNDEARSELEKALQLNPGQTTAREALNDL